MGRIVVDGRERVLAYRQKSEAGGTRRWNYRKFQFDVYGPQQYGAVSEHIETIKAHFGVNKADAMKIALKLTADAARAGRLRL